MLKALFKKQLMEVNAWLFRSKKSGRQRSGAGIAGMILLYALVFVCLGAMFYFMGGMLCGPLVSMGLGWLYFAMMGLVSVLLGVFGSVFSTYATLYRAKDNDFLLSLPIPPTGILAVRLFGVWMWGLIYEAVVMLPALLVYWMAVPLSLSVVLAGVLLLLILSFFVLTLSCLLGWVVAGISARLKHKSIVTMLASLAFLAAYFYIYSQAYEALQKLLANAQTVGERLRGAAYPLYLMGRAGEGGWLDLLLVALIAALLFGLTWLALSRSFLKLATAARSGGGKRYRETAAKQGSVGGALLAREGRRFLSSSTYMLNCGLGTILMVVAAAALLIRGDLLMEMLGSIPGVPEGAIPLAACAAICLISCMNDTTAPSVSLEGKNLWLVQVLPVSGWQVLKAKLKLHLSITWVPVLLLTAGVEWVLRPTAAYAVLLPVVALLFILLMAELGLTVNLLIPNLNWTNEIVPIKQSMSVMVTLFGGWLLVIALGGLYYLLRHALSPVLYLLCVAAALLLACVGLLAWLKRKGSRIFERL